jgi:hypothetical protein
MSRSDFHHVPLICQMDSGSITFSSAQQVVSSQRAVAPPAQALNFIQPVNRRYHLPSQEEARQSFQLIEKWKTDIGALNQQISSAEAALRANLTALRSDLEAEMAALRYKYQAAEEALEEQARRRTALPRSLLEDLEKRLALEQEFVAGIRKVPDEILVEILKHYLGNDLPSRRLASVCKGWKALLQNTPSFWRNLQSSFISAEYAEHAVAVLQRRIDLSRSTLLDVTLNGYLYEQGGTDLFKLISKTGIERWRSLDLSSAWSWQNTKDTSLEGIFVGNFVALQSLRWSIPLLAADPFIPIYQLIIQSSPPIKQLAIGSLIPLLFQGSSTFRRIHELQTTASGVSQLVPLHHLKTLRINGPLGHDFSFHGWPPLPTYTLFEYGITRQQLNALSRQSVKEFVVGNLIGEASGLIVDFPELTSLSITEGGFCSSIENVFAPKLTDLQITDYWGKSASRKKKISDTISFLRERPDNIMLRPTTLTLNIPVNTTAVLAILQHWPQLQHFTLTFGDDFAWNAAFPNAFTRKKSPLCPELRTLRLILKIKDFEVKEEQWKKTVMSIYLARRNTPLQTIVWMFDGLEWRGGGKWYNLSTETQDL